MFFLGIPRPGRFCCWLPFFFPPPTKHSNGISQLVQIPWKNTSFITLPGAGLSTRRLHHEVDRSRQNPIADLTKKSVLGSKKTPGRKSLILRWGFTASYHWGYNP